MHGSGGYDVGMQRAGVSEAPEPALDDRYPDWWPVEYQQEFRHWWVWRGIAGLLYARRIMSSPPRVVRAESVEDLREKIVSARADMEAGRGWPGGVPRHGAI